MNHPNAHARSRLHTSRRKASQFVGATLLMAGALTFTAGCSPSNGDLGAVATPPPTGGASVDVPSPEPTAGAVPTVEPASSGGATASPGGERTTIRAYFFLGSFTHPAGLAAVLREIPTTRAVATAAMNALLAGPGAAEVAARPAMYTSVPSQTRLLGLTISDGVATVNLSREFESGGGSASVLGRLGQVVFTLTQFATVKSVAFELDGQPVTVFSGEGVVLDHPVGRSDFTDQLPAIWVDRPAWGAAIGNPARIVGMANVFEATFRVAIFDGTDPVKGQTPLVDELAMATCGTGCWGTFDVTLRYAVPSARWGVLRVYDLSARDGSPENVTDYPVWLTPGS